MPVSVLQRTMIVIGAHGLQDTVASNSFASRRAGRWPIRSSTGLSRPHGR